MSDETKVVSLAGSRAKRSGPKPRPEVIESLRELLAKAETGELQDFAAVWSNESDCGAHYHIEADHTYTIGQLHMLATELASLDFE